MSGTNYVGVDVIIVILLLYHKESCDFICLLKTDKMLSTDSHKVEQCHLLRGSIFGMFCRFFREVASLGMDNFVLMLVCSFETHFTS